MQKLRFNKYVIIIAISIIIFVFLIGYKFLSPEVSSDYAQPSNKKESKSILPWGAMYTQNEFLTFKGMRGSVKYYRGRHDTIQLIEDLNFAQSHNVKLILSIGSLDPNTYLDRNGNIDMRIVHQELDPFFNIADSIEPFISDGTVWGIRFMDEPHDIENLISETQVKTSVNKEQLGVVYALIKSRLGSVRVGSTSPSVYMIHVPNADYASGQYNHSNPPSYYSDPRQFFETDSNLAYSYGLDYVASLNANTNSIGNLEFFKAYNLMCSIENIDFVTSWKWSQGGYPEPSFEVRLNDPTPEVQAEISKIRISCER